MDPVPAKGKNKPTGEKWSDILYKLTFRVNPKCSKVVF